MNTSWRRLAGLAAAVWALPSVTQALDPSRSLRHYSIDAWRTTDGLPQNTVRSVLQTGDGYLWIGTEEGVARFDGLAFKTFDTSNAPLPRNYIESLYQTRDGALWLGTYHGGLTRLANGRFQTYTTRDGLCGSGGTGFAEGADGSLWFGALDAGLCRFRDGAFTTYRRAQGLPDEQVNAVLQARDGTLWVGTEGGLARGRDGRFTALGPRDGLPSEMVSALAEDRTGAVWIGTAAGVARMFDGRITVHGAESLPSVAVRALHVDAAGSVWIGTDGGLTRHRAGRFESFDSGEGPGPYGVLAIASDHEGSLWVGTEGGGLSRLKDGKVVTFGTRDPRWRPNVTAVTGDGQGGLWMGGSGGQLSRFQRGVVTVVESEDALRRSQVRTLYRDREGLWIGTDRGLHLQAGGTFRALDGNGLPASPVRAVLRDRRGHLWVGTDGGGLARREGARFVTYRAAQGLSGDNVRFIHEDRRGRLWIGTYGGLSLYEDGRFRHFGEEQGLTDLLVRSIHEDADGVFWIGTYGGGLFRFADERFSAIGSRHGLPSDIIYGIAEDAAGHLWMSCNKGIFRVSREELSRRAAGQVQQVKVTTFGVDEGMKGNECNGGNPAVWRHDDGSLWFPTLKGLVRVDPAYLPSNPVPPPVVIDSVLVDGTEVDIQDGARLEPGRRRLEVRFAGLSFLAPARVRMAFKLEGFDPDWVDAGPQRSASYTNLPPGNYTFRVKAANADGVANEAGASLALSQEPRFYETTAFSFLCVAGMVAFTFAAYQVRIAQLRGRERELKRRIAEALASVKVLSGLLPVCAACKKIRDDKGYWNQIETYIRDHSEADFSHGMCPDCVQRLYPEIAERVLRKPPLPS